MNIKCILLAVFVVFAPAISIAYSCTSATEAECNACVSTYYGVTDCDNAQSITCCKQKLDGDCTATRNVKCHT